MTYLNRVDSNRQMILTNDLMYQTMQDPSDEAETAFVKPYLLDRYSK